MEQISVSSVEEKVALERGVKTLKEVKEVFHKWLYIEDDTVLDIILATIIANKYEGDPLWLFIVSPPGSTKTEILRSLREVPEVFSVSKLTEHTLVSGLRIKGKDPSLLPELDGKVLVIKDFTSLLQMRRESRGVVFADLRDCYDGYADPAFGSEARVARYKSEFGIIAAVVPEIDRFWSLNQQLGERFLKFRPTIEDKKKAIEKARQNRGKEKTMRQELMDVMSIFLLYCPTPPLEEIKYADGVDDKIIDAALFLALVRSEVSRDRYTKDIEYLPEGEVGTRLVKQLTGLAQGLATVRDKREIGKDEYAIIKKVVKDTLPSKKRVFIEALMTNKSRGYLTTQEYSNLTDFDTNTCRRALEDFRLLKIVERQGSSEFEWRLTQPTYDLILKADL